MSSVVLFTALPLPPIVANGIEQIYVPFVGDHSVFHDAQAIIVTPNTPIDKTLINSLPESIGLIATLGVGLDHIDLDAATNKGIIVTNTPVVTEDTADLTMALILSTCRRLTDNETLLRSGEWATQYPQTVIGSSVNNKTLGIIGLGSIGKALAQRASGFNMNILYHGRTRQKEHEKNLGLTYCSHIEELLEKSDIVSLHCPLTNQTKHLMNALRLKKMKKGAFLINTGRGKLIDEHALLDVLKSEHLAGAGLDVFEHEPKITQGLMDIDSVVLLPHIGSATFECRTNMMNSCTRNIKNFIEGNFSKLNKVN